MLYNILAIVYCLGPFVGLWFIFRKAGIASWKALVPIYNIILWIKLCGKDWKWYIYFLIPAINVFTFLLLVVETAKVFGRHGLGEQTLASLFPFVYLPYLGLSKLEYQNPTLQDKKNRKKYSKVREWVDAVIFALIAAVIIRGFNFELYNIPSSSMEKSLLVGDYLMVSKMAYGPRSAMTPLSLPLVHNVIPFTDGQRESYLKWIKFPYHRYPGMGSVNRFDATVFNYPDGDTVASIFKSNRSYHDLVREYGRETVHSNKGVFGNIVVRPVDKRENFIKRCIGLPGEQLEIRDQQVFIDGTAISTPAGVQFNYAVRMRESMDDYLKSMAQMGAFGGDLVDAKLRKDKGLLASFGISLEDCENSFGFYEYFYLNEAQIEVVRRYSKYFNVEPMGYCRDSLRLVRLAPRSNLVDRGGQERAIAAATVQMYGDLSEAGVPDSIFEICSAYYTIPMTAETAQTLARSAQVMEALPLSAVAGYSGLDLFPHAEGYSWSIDNFGPVTIPSKGTTVKLSLSTLPLYRRVIEVYEGNSLEVRDGRIYINGSEADTYTFKMDYYWMMGDNRHNSADSRFWGFVPEDHIVGRARTVLASWDSDHRTFRWKRFLKCKF